MSDTIRWPDPNPEWKGITLSDCRVIRPVLVSNGFGRETKHILPDQMREFDVIALARQLPGVEVVESLADLNSCHPAAPGPFLVIPLPERTSESGEPPSGRGRHIRGT
ncbi:MAG: hypothetical protein J5I28_07900 [Acidimicrobiales bacterium]|nr:hypothetical protein [Acidimicrobiales bacterium]